MENKDTNRDGLKSIWDSLRKGWDEVKLQTGLGKLEVTEQFESLKKEAYTYSQSAMKSINELPDSPAVQSMKAKLEELNLQLTLGKAEAMDEFDTQKSALKNQINAIRNEVNENEEFRSLKAGMDENLQSLKGKMEMMNMKFHLAWAEGREDLKEAAAKISDEISRMGQSLEKEVAEGSEGARQKMMAWEEEAEKKLDQFKDWFKKQA